MTCETCCCGNTATVRPAALPRITPPDLLHQLQAVRHRLHTAHRAAADSDRCIEATIGDGLRELSLLKRLINSMAVTS